VAAPVPPASRELTPVSLRDLCLYFLKLGALGFGGPIALAGYMRRDLEEQRHWVTDDEYQDGLAIAQTMPGPLAAQLAMWIGYIRYGVLGASLVGVLFILPPFLLVLAVAAIYDAVEGLSQIRALFYGIGPAAIAIITLAAWKLAKTTNKVDPKLWAVSAALMAITIITHSELAYLFIVAGLLGILVYARPKRWPRWRVRRKPRLAGLVPFAPGSIGFLPVISGTTLVAVGLFFLKAAAFTFGSGLAIVPFLHQGVVVEHKWLTEHQFLDAVAMGLISPGPVVIMATFVGYLAAGFLGAVVATIAVFAPVWVFNVVIGRIFLRYRQNPQVRGFVKGVTAAAVGAIAGAAVLLGRGAITDVWTVVIFAAALLILYVRKLKEPYVVGLAGLAGLLLYSR